MPRNRGTSEEFVEVQEEPVKRTIAEELEQMKKYADWIKHNYEKLAQSADTIQKALNENTVALQTDMATFVRTKAAVEGALDKCNNKGRVKLNVGGVKYETTLTTLTAEGDNSMLGSMFSGRHELHPNDDGEVFIDRDGTHFGYILNMLRDANVEVPIKDRSAFQAELCYHGITAKRCQRLVKYVDASGNEVQLDAYGRQRYPGY
jgi:hypothetical protein